MPYLNRVVCELNEKLIKEAFSFLPAGTIKAYGLTESVIEAEEDNTKKYPAAIDDNGEATMIDIDDLYSLMMYHKLDSITNSTEKLAMGDGQGNPVESANMALIVFAFRDKVKCGVDMLEAVIKDKLPDVRANIRNNTGALLQNSIFRAGNSTFDKITLLGREYSSIPLLPELLVFELKYRIDSTWRKGCLTIC